MDLYKPIDNLSNEEYHKVREGSERAYSSSQLKDLLDDPEVFYKKYITKEIEADHVAAFDVGTYIHTAILEPEKLAEECAVWTGKMRKGAEWDAFQAANAGKAIITYSEYEKAMNAINGIKSSDIASAIYNNGKSEVSIFVEVFVKDGEIYIESEGRVARLDLKKGWVGCTTNLGGAVRIVIKCRADKIYTDGERPSDNYIADIKSTTGNPKNEFSIQGKVREYKYDMSAALYLDVFNAGGIFATPLYKIDNFYWTFATKDYPMSKTWLASDKQIAVGRAKWKRAVVELAKCIENDWAMVDEIGVVEPASFEDDWLKDTPAKKQVALSVKKELVTNNEIDL